MALAESLGLLGFFLALGAILFIILIAFYIYYALVLMTIAKKTKTPNAWLAWIPIANVYLMTQIGGVPGWVTLAVLLPIIPILGSLAFAAVFVWLWWKIAEARGRPGWWGVLIGLVPIANVIFMGMLAWSEK